MFWAGGTGSISVHVVKLGLSESSSAHRLPVCAVQSEGTGDREGVLVKSERGLTNLEPRIVAPWECTSKASATRRACRDEESARDARVLELGRVAENRLLCL